MPNINRVVLEGELVAAPVMDGGCCRFTLLVVTMRKEAEGWVGRPNQFEVVAWAAAAEEAMTLLRPGHPVGVEGELAWDSEELADGSRRQHVWVVADKVRALDLRAALLIPADKEAGDEGQQVAEGMETDEGDEESEPLAA